jgi:hypothetical protein
MKKMENFKLNDWEVQELTVKSEEINGGIRFAAGAIAGGLLYEVFAYGWQHCRSEFLAGWNSR